MATNLTYDALGRVASETTRVGSRAARVTGSTWGLNGGAWQRQVVRPDGTTALEAFDTLGRLATMQRPSGRTTAWEHQGGFETRVSSATRAGSPFRRSVTHDGLGQALAWTLTGLAAARPASRVRPG